MTELKPRTSRRRIEFRKADLFMGAHADTEESCLEQWTEAITALEGKDAKPKDGELIEGASKVAKKYRAMQGLHPDKLPLLEALEDCLKALQGGQECEWKPDDPDWESWEGSCGAAWTFNDGGPVDNNMNYCPECGGKVILPPAPAEESENE